VGPLKQQNAAYDCYWTAQAPALGPREIFLASAEDGSWAAMNIGGRDVSLRLLSERGSLLPGHVLVRTFAARGTRVVARFKVTQACAAGDSCENQDYKVIFEVTQGKRRQIVRATGSVGC
ncbi:hypothetical protein, partial [Lysobacter xanthus]